MLVWRAAQPWAEQCAGTLEVLAKAVLEMLGSSYFHFSLAPHQRFQRGISNYPYPLEFWHLVELSPLQQV